MFNNFQLFRKKNNLKPKTLNQTDWEERK